jgi:phage shock protein E
VRKGLILLLKTGGSFIKSFILTLLLSISLNIFSMIVIDVRTTNEWEKGHLENSINIDWQNILSISSTLTKDQEIYLYCRSGNRSEKALKILKEAGYKNVINAGSIDNASSLLNIEIVY